MHKPWPKCTVCNFSMSLNRGTSLVEFIAEANQGAFMCEHCPPKPRHIPPTTPKIVP
jgi:hypothetical protein